MLGLVGPHSRIIIVSAIHGATGDGLTVPPRTRRRGERWSLASHSHAGLCCRGSALEARCGSLPVSSREKEGATACRRRRKTQAGSKGWRGGAGGNALPALRLARIDRSEVGSRVVVCCRSRLAGFLAQRSGWPHLNRFGPIRGRAPSSRSTSARKCAARGRKGSRIGSKRKPHVTAKSNRCEPRTPRRACDGRRLGLLSWLTLHGVAAEAALAEAREGRIREKQCALL